MGLCPGSRVTWREGFLGMVECVGGGARPPPREEEEDGGAMPRLGIGRLRSRLGVGSRVGIRRGEDVDVEAVVTGWGMPDTRGFFGRGGGGISTEGAAGPGRSDMVLSCGTGIVMAVLPGADTLGGCWGVVAPTRLMAGDVDMSGTIRIGVGSSLGADISGTRVRVGTAWSDGTSCVAEALGVVCSSSCSSVLPSPCDEEDPVTWMSGSCIIIGGGCCCSCSATPFSRCRASSFLSSSFLALAPISPDGAMGGLVAGPSSLCWRQLARNLGNHCGGRRQKRTTDATIRESPIMAIVSGSYRRHGISLSLSVCVQGQG